MQAWAPLAFAGLLPSQREGEEEELDDPGEWECKIGLEEGAACGCTFRTRKALLAHQR